MARSPSKNTILRNKQPTTQAKLFKKSSDEFPYVWVCCKCEKFNGTKKYFRNNELCIECKHSSCSHCIDTEPVKPKVSICNWICCQCFEFKNVIEDSSKCCRKCKHLGCDECFDAE